MMIKREINGQTEQIVTDRKIGRSKTNVAMNVAIFIY